MKLRMILQNAYLALRHNVRRSLLTMAGIIIGVSAVITILSLGNGFKAYTMKNLTQSNSQNIDVEINFSPNNPVSTGTFFNESDLHLAESVSGVDSAAYQADTQTTVMQDFYFGTTKYSKTVGLMKKSEEDLRAGRNLTQKDDDERATVAVISSDLADKISSDEQSVLGYGIPIDGELYTVVGIFTGGGEMSLNGDVEIPKRTYEYLHSQNKTISAIKIKVQPGHKPSSVADNVVQELTDNGSMTTQGTYTTFDMSGLLDGISKILSTLTLFISGIAGISLFIAGVGVMNMMYTSVSERTQEIGVRRAMGARKSDIRQQFLAEGLLLTVSSGLIGYVIGYLIALLISQFMPFKVVPDLFTIALSLGITTVLGLIFSVAPANAAARKELVEILR
ncbi:ABC transporter permease [Lactovum odontotermitis]